MIYTVGHRESYDKGLADAEADERGPLCKLGRKPDLFGSTYGGGVVFRHASSAAMYLTARDLPTYSVYALAADWMKDTAEDPDDPNQRRLMRDAVVLHRVVAPGREPEGSKAR